MMSGYVRNTTVAGNDFLCTFFTSRSAARSRRAAPVTREPHDPTPNPQPRRALHDPKSTGIGSTAVSAWGDTEALGALDAALPPGYGADGTAGNQPRGNRVVGNLCRELGIWEKQSSCYTQFKASENVVTHNIMYNGPRAHVNFNDG
jgi:hypothetical protein